MSAPAGWDLLVDRRTGVVTATEHFGNPPEWPRDFVLVTGAVADVGHDRPWHADRQSTGTAYGSLRQATFGALGEAVERYCGNFVPAGLRRASWHDLAAEGTAALDPTTLRLHSDEQYATPGFPIERFTRDVAVRWTQGRDLVTEAPVLVPASLVHVNYLDGERVGEPVTNFVVYAGIAAGPDRRFAETSAMEEVIERDAVELWWDSGRPAPRLELPPALRERMTACAETEGARRLEYVALAVPGPWRVPVVAVAVRDRWHDLVAIGTAARPDPAEAVLKAAGEAVSLRSLAKGMLDPDGSPWQMVADGLVDGTALKPWRADRAYLDDYRDDFRDVGDLLCQTQVHLDPRTRAWTDHLFGPSPAGTVTLESLAGLVPDGAEPWEHYRDELVRVGGHHPLSTDVTTSDVAEAGLAVVRVTAPGTYGNAPAGFALRDPARRTNRVRVPIPHT